MSLSDGTNALTERFCRDLLFQTLCHLTLNVFSFSLQVFLEAESVVVPRPDDFVYVALVSFADVAEPRVSVDIGVAFAVLVPASVVGSAVDSPRRPKFLAFPNAHHFASSASSVEDVGEESVHSSIGARTSYGPCSILSNLNLHQNRNPGHYHNNPNPGHNNLSDTSDLATDATTNHRRNRCLRLSQEQRRHPYPVARSLLVVRQIRWVVAEKFQYLFLPIPTS
jgi:hypothetical protein